MDNCKKCHNCLSKEESQEFFTIGGFTIPKWQMQMILCETCRNKRCPHATDHRHLCTGSNEPGQEGSLYK